MKTLFCSCLLVLASALYADMPDGFFEKYLASMFTPHAKPEAPEQKNGKILEHSEITPSVTSEAEVLEGPIEDPAKALENKNKVILAGADVPSPARAELHTQESIEDLKYGPISGQGPNEDESLREADLDLKLLNPNPSGTDAVRNAAPAA